MQFKQINVGLIGFSVGGQVFHAPFIKCTKGLKLYKVLARKQEQKEILKEKYPEAYATEQVDEIIYDKDIDLIVIATSNDVHFDLAKKALLAGKHVVVEKPFTVFSYQADELIELARSKGLLLTVHHNARLLSDYLAVKEVLSSGKLGQVKNYEARFDRFRNYLRPGAWREEDLPGSGIHYDLGSHLIDQSIELFGLPNAVFADLRKQRENAQAVDDFEILLYYPSLKVSLKGQMLAKEPTPRYSVFGRLGTFIKYAGDNQEARLREGTFPCDKEDWGQEEEGSFGVLNYQKNGQDLQEHIASPNGNMPKFYENIKEVLWYAKPLLVQPERARDVVRILELCELSAEQKKVVSLEAELISGQ